MRIDGDTSHSIQLNLISNLQSTSQQVYRANLTATINVLQRHYRVCFDSNSQKIYLHSVLFGNLSFKKIPRLIVKDQFEDAKAGGLYKAHMSGKIVKVVVETGKSVQSGDTLLILESMKMETKIIALQDGVVKEIFVSEGNVVQDNEPLLVVKPNGP